MRELYQFLRIPLTFLPCPGLVISQWRADTVTDYFFVSDFFNHSTLYSNIVKRFTVNQVVLVQKFSTIILGGLVVFFLVQCVSAFTVSSINITPMGDLNPNDPVTVSYSVYAASGVAFPSFDDLQFITELDDPRWSYAIGVNGIENERPVTGGRTLTISGFELAYRNQDGVIVKASLQGRVPLSSLLGTNKTLIKIQELDSRGNVIPYSVVKVEHLIGQPTPTPTPSFGRISVASNPAGATIYLDNAIKGLTPLTVDSVPNGNHIVVLRLDGYQDSLKNVMVTADTQSLNAVLIPTTTPATTRTTATGTQSPAQTSSPQVTGSGSLLVTTTPPGAQVYVDGSMKGISPTTIPGLSPGPHAIILKMEGYQDLTTSITVTTGQTSEYSTGLFRNAKTPGFEALGAVLSLGVLFVMGRIRH
jgi:hypothetical protein